MRVFARLAVLGILVISCRDTIIGPDPYGPGYEPYVCEPTAPDTTFGGLYLDSLRVVMGGAESIYLDWSTYDGCLYEALPSQDLTWTIRDSTIVRDSVPEWSVDGWPRYMLPKAPGQTVITVESPLGSDSIFFTVPDTTAMGTPVDVGAGPSLSCAVEDGGTVWCWGGSRVLGEWDDPALGTCMGSLCSPMPVAVGTGAESVYAQSGHICILDAAGTASCLGENYSGQLGVSGFSYSSTLVPVSGGHTFTSLSLGWQHSCGITGDGAAYCWGNGPSGALGGDFRDYNSATPINVDEALSWVSIEAKQTYTCGVSDEGHLYCWGVLGTAGEDGPPGAERCEAYTNKDGSTSSSPCAFTPLRIPLLTPTADSLFTQVSGRCALTTGGAVYCYDSREGAYRPMAALGSFESLTSGSSHTCGLRSAGTAACWGANWVGQLGDGTAFDRSTPVPVDGGYIWDRIAAGGDHTCGLTMDRVWCWGGTHVGQAGTSVLEPQLVPAKVHGQS